MTAINFVQGDQYLRDILNDLHKLCVKTETQELRELSTMHSITNDPQGVAFPIPGTEGKELHVTCINGPNNARYHDTIMLSCWDVESSDCLYSFLRSMCDYDSPDDYAPYAAAFLVCLRCHIEDFGFRGQCTRQLTLGEDGMYHTQECGCFNSGNEVNDERQ